VANAGASQLVNPGDLVTLNGNGSTDLNGYSLTYAWSILSKPGGSVASLSDPTLAGPTFVADKAGTYIVQLIVSDPLYTSTPATVTVSTGVLAPLANAGSNQTVSVGSSVTVSAVASVAYNGYPLTYAWAILSAPPSSSAVLSDNTAATPSFTADKAGTYVVQLIVSDPLLSSPPVTVTITATCPPPVANAGMNATVATGSQVQLNGAASSGSSGYALTYGWTLASVPPGSTAALSDPSSPAPTFVADLAGTYSVTLVVNDRTQDSAPATVTITASDSAQKPLHR
jgi:hypothetical protein